MILTLANVKGGVGKTTLAVNLAIARTIAGRRVLLIDADEQGSAADFTQNRVDQLGHSGYSVARMYGEDIRSRVQDGQASYQDIIIDVGGHESDSLRVALSVAETVLIPVQPGTFDVWSFERIATLVGEARKKNHGLRALAVLNAADSQGQDNGQARELLQEVDGIHVLPTILIRRKAYRNAAAQGRSVLDVTPRDPKAVHELTAVAEAVFTL